MVPVASTLVATLTKSNNTYTLTILYVNEERRSIDVLTSLDIESENELVSYSLQSQKGVFCILGMQHFAFQYQFDPSCQCTPSNDFSST